MSAGPSCDQSPSNPNPGRSKELFMKQAVFHYSHECATPPHIPTLVNAILSQKSPTTPCPPPRQVLTRATEEPRGDYSQRSLSERWPGPPSLRSGRRATSPHTVVLWRVAGAEATHSQSRAPGCSAAGRASAERATPPATPPAPEQSARRPPPRGAARPLTARSGPGWAPTLGRHLLARPPREEGAPRPRPPGPAPPTGGSAPASPAAAAVPAPPPP